ncbi:hypothetical protein F5B22DRAFT_641563 [Xylaria bambusicola]|uniref:uncharacterized protein n=1 Tax=Xylaria bambusicola TaxID=326684 RepID=UPI00200791E8|nr:uncharacterized protein F5B22DRAFT_641563 [Xylaria bambusicola]KAI0526417.1 hypothetical protein F5B22DRAFT_641563 [Xylaria bambusicola]
MPTDNGVEVKQSQMPDAGKGLYAQVAFSPGEIVASVDRPLVTELEADRMLDTCAWCCQRAATDPIERKTAASMGLPHGFTEVKSCTGCRKVAYCSRACQSKAWKREHKYECKVISVEDLPPLPPGVRGAIKIIGRSKADPDNEVMHTHKIINFWPAGDPNAMLEIHRLDKKRFDDFQVLGHAAWIYSGKPQADRLDLKSISRKVVSNIMSNAIILSSVFDGVPLGIAFDPLISSANHSCDPNAVLVFNQPRHEIRALRKIKAGEEILISYVEATNPFNVRQMQLKENYLFTCQCTRCLKGGNLETDKFLVNAEDLENEYRKLADKLVNRHETKLSKFLLSDNDNEAQKRLAAMEAEAYSVLENDQAGTGETKEAIEMCIGSKMWSWTRQPIPQLCRRLATQYLQSGLIYEAFRIGVKLHIEILPALYPQEFHPDRVINAWAVSTLINVLCGAAHEELYEELAKGGVQLRVLYFGFLFYLHDHTPRIFRSDSPFARVIEITYTQIMAGVTYSEAELKEKVQAAWPALEALANNVSISNF